MYCLELLVSDVFPWVAGLPDVVLLDDLPQDGEGQRPQQLPPLREAVANLHDLRLGRLQSRLFGLLLRERNYNLQGFYLSR